MADKPSRITFLNKLYSAIRSHLGDGGFMTADEFADVFRRARGHAGGKAKAEKMLMMAEGDPTGCIVCLVPDPDTAAALAVAGGLAPDALHLTLCMFGDVATLGPVQRAEALLAARDAALSCAPLAGEISGIGRFTNGEQDVIYASLDAPKLNDLRECICSCLEACGMEIADDHGFTPHITLAYVDRETPNPIEIVEPRSVRFDAIEVWCGAEHTSLPLLGMDAEGGDGEADVAGTPYEYLAGEGSPTIAGYVEPTSSGTLTITASDSSRYLLGDLQWNSGSGTISLGSGGTSAREIGGEAARKIEAAPAAASEDLADMAAHGHKHRLFNRVKFAEAPAWIPYLPKPGSYAHPRYGTITITRDRNQRFVSNFEQKVYQDRLPIDAEHETKLSGAAGWITGMRMNADGSADAKVEWTDRGRTFFKDDRFRYFSPEWYDAWQQPDTGQTYQDVAIGGALTTRPFFKDPALRPLIASEGSLAMDDNPEGETMEPQQFAELETKLAERENELNALKAASEAQAAQNKQLAEQVERMAAERMQDRFTALIKNDGARWFGEASQHLTVLGTLAKTFGEDSAEFKAYVEQQKGVAATLRASSAFQEIGGDGAGRTESNDEKLTRMARERASERKIDFAQAYTEVLVENPALYAE